MRFLAFYSVLMVFELGLLTFKTCQGSGYLSHYMQYNANNNNEVCVERIHCYIKCQFDTIIEEFMFSINGHLIYSCVPPLGIGMCNYTSISDFTTYIFKEIGWKTPLVLRTLFYEQTTINVTCSHGTEILQKTIEIYSQDEWTSTESYIRLNTSYSAVLNIGDVVEVTCDGTHSKVPIDIELYSYYRNTSLVRINNSVSKTVTVPVVLTCLDLSLECISINTRIPSFRSISARNLKIKKCPVKIRSYSPLSPISLLTSESTSFYVNYNSAATPNVSWVRVFPRREIQLMSNNKPRIENYITNDYTRLNIYNVQVEDSGLYKVYINNEVSVQTVEFKLKVIDFETESETTNCPISKEAETTTPNNKEAETTTPNYNEAETTGFSLQQTQASQVTRLEEGIGIGSGIGIVIGIILSTAIMVIVYYICKKRKETSKPAEDEDHFNLQMGNKRGEEKMH